MADFDYKNFDLCKNYAIEASAGTGKTYTIQKVVRRLLLEKNLNINEILIVTYTEKATGELKDRIRKELLDIDNIDISNLQIYTIHSFCNNMINEFAYELKHPMELNTISEDDALRLIEEIIRDDNEIKNILKKYDSSLVEKVKETLIAALGSYYLNMDYNEDKNIISLCSDIVTSSKKLKEKFSDIDNVLNEVETIINKLPTNNKTNIALKDDAQNNLDNFRNSINLLDNDCIPFSPKISVKKAFDKTGLLNHFERMKEITSILKNKEYGIDDIIVGRFLPKIYKLWQEYKIKNKLQTFNDMIRIVREEMLIDNSEFSRSLKNKFKYGIIDEFQDTNGLQWDIFKEIFLNNDHNIIVVGDPKQSIYSFQGADIDVYKKAISEIVSNGGIKASLSTNYRSTSDMINACNSIFNTNNFFYDINFKYTDSKSPNNNQKEGKFDGKSYKPIWILDNVDENQFAEAAVQKIIECTETINNKTRLQIKKKNIKEIYEWKNVDYNDFAILARTRSEENAIVNYLKEYGVPFVKYKDPGLFSTIECTNWIAILEAINSNELTGKNSKIFKKALFSKFFNKSLYEINNDLYNKDSSNEMNIIKNWQEMVKNNQWEDLIDSIIIDSKMIDRMSDSKKIDSFSKYKQIGDIIISYLTSNHTLLDTIEYLKNKKDNLGSNDDEEKADDIISRGTNFPCITIMTIYASKGLEFPIVISTTGFKAPFPSNEKYIYKDINGLKVIDFDKTKEYENEQKMERMRLLYVDYTRASYLLIMPNYSEDILNDDCNLYLNKILNEYIANDNNKKYFDLIQIDNDKDHYIDIAKDNLKRINDNIIDLFDDDKKELFDNKLKKTKKGIKKASLYKHSYSSLSHSNNDDITYGDMLDFDKERESKVSLEEFDTKYKKIELDYDSNKKLDISSNYPKGANIGTTLHEIFEHYDFTNNNDYDLEKIIIDRFNANGIKYDNWINDTKKIVRNVLNAKFIDTVNNENIFKLANIDNDDKLPEVEFNIGLLGRNNSILNNYCNGFIDLVFRYNNKYYIIDWKSDSLNDDEFESYSYYDSLNSHVNKCYSIQRVLYSYYLIKWLSQNLNKSNEEIFNNYFGGIYYVFLKGCVNDTSNGIYAHNWESFDELKNAYDYILLKKIHLK